MSLTRRATSLLYRRPWMVLAGAALSLAPALWAASRLGLETDFKDLLPRSRPSVVEMDRLAAHLHSGVSLKTIGDLLGHRDSDSTYVYLRLATEELREVALPVPTLTPHPQHEEPTL